MWDDKLWENSWLVVAERGLQAVSFEQSLQNKPVGRRETVSKTFLVYHVELFSVPTLCGSFWKSWRESPNNWQCLVVPWTKSLLFHLNRWKLHIVWFSNWSELLCCFDTDVLGLETSLSRVVVKKLTVRKKLKKSTTRRKKWKKTSLKEDQEDLIPLLLLQTTFCTRFLPMLKCTSTIRKFTTLIECMHKNLTFPTTSLRPSLNARDFCTAKGKTICWWKYGNAFVWTFFLKENENAQQTRWLPSCCLVICGLIFSPLPNCHFQIWNLGYD